MKSDGRRHSLRHTSGSGWRGQGGGARARQDPLKVDCGGVVCQNRVSVPKWLRPDEISGLVDKLDFFEKCTICRVCVCVVPLAT